MVNGKIWELGNHLDHSCLNLHLIAWPKLIKYNYMSLKSPFASIKQLLLGKPLTSNSSDSVLLPKSIALPVFASDALSSVAYAPNEILLTLALAGTSFTVFSPLVGLAVTFILFIIIISYTQNVKEYPSGGGDYEIVKDDLGERYGRLVGASLFIDYVLTVAVSVSSGTEYIVSMIPALSEKEVYVALIIIVLITIVNLRGVKESGSFFAIPVYCFIASTLTVILTGFFQYFTGNLHQVTSASYDIISSDNFATPLLVIFLFARSFASGTTALTGIEAISNGVPSFRRPKSKNAAKTLLMLGGISAFMLLSILFLASVTGLKYVQDPYKQLLVNGQHVDESFLQLPAIGQLSQSIFSTTPIVFFIVSFFTGIILFLAANTAFNGFPILCSILAKDKFMPQYMTIRGGRLAFSNGVIILMVLSLIVVAIFKADVSNLVHLYVVGVFISFTLSQFSMIKHWNKKLRKLQAIKEEYKEILKIKLSRLVNLIGFSLTAVVLVIILSTKFLNGAWMSITAVLLVWLFMSKISKYYNGVRSKIAIDSEEIKNIKTTRTYTNNLSILLVNDLSKPIARSIKYIKETNSDEFIAVHVNVDNEKSEQVMDHWIDNKIDLPLRIISSPYREITKPIMYYVQKLQLKYPKTLITFYVPEYIEAKWWSVLLHNQTALRLRIRMRELDGVIIAAVPWRL